METYCEKDRETGEYAYFFKSKLAVSLCGVRREDIVKVRITEDDIDTATHWAYLEVETGQFEYIFKNKVQVEICSPDSFKRSMKEGSGKIVKVKVEEV